ncbi:unnamed protein product [Musa hybrid cultivar]
MDVANEMVKELEITDRQPSEIVGMIAREIAVLVPDWKARGGHSDLHHVYNYADDAEDGCNHPFYNLSSPASSPCSAFGVGQYVGVLGLQQHPHQEGWLRGGLFSDDDDMSSTHSGKYSALTYTSGNEQESEMSSRHSESSHNATRFCADERHTEDTSLANQLEKKCNVSSPEPSRKSRSRTKEVDRPAENRRLTRNLSMVDMRSQLLHRNLVDQLKKRLFKTVGAVEHIGFQMPSDGSRRPPPSSSSRGDGRKHQQQGHARGRR